MDISKQTSRADFWRGKNESPASLSCSVGCRVMLTSGAMPKLCFSCLISQSLEELFLVQADCLRRKPSYLLAPCGNIHMSTWCSMPSDRKCGTLCGTLNSCLQRFKGPPMAQGSKGSAPIPQPASLQR